MSDAAWETLSNQAIGAAGVVYFLALLAYLLQWSALRQVAPARTTSAVASTSGGGVAVMQGPDSGPDSGPGAATAGPAERSERSEERAEFFGRLALLLTGLACAVHFVSMVGRGMAANPNRVPWGNMYEFTVSGTFVVVLLFLLVRRRYDLTWMAPVVVAFTLTFLMVAVLVLYQPVVPLSDALSSYWLVIHVVSAIIATGAFTLGGMLSAVYLVKGRAEAKGTAGTGWMAKVPSLATLDRTSYRVHAFGFPVWTFAVLITGPIWAHQAWSHYWNWDPKEVFAFITWVVYAAYLHARATAGWKGRNAAIVALVGLATLWFNFVGINYFSTTSQHSYANGAPVSTSTVLGQGSGAHAGTTSLR